MFKNPKKTTCLLPQYNSRDQDYQTQVFIHNIECQILKIYINQLKLFKELDKYSNNKPKTNQTRVIS
jgi:hypothetical protein